jgi:hypothetical protein
MEKTTFKNLHKEHEEYFQEERRIEDDSKKGRGVKLIKNEHIDFYQIQDKFGSYYDTSVHVIRILKNGKQEFLKPDKMGKSMD